MKHRRHRGGARLELMRLKTLQESLEALIAEARQLRERLELRAAAERLATRMILGTAHKRRRMPDLSRADRVF